MTAALLALVLSIGGCGDDDAAARPDATAGDAGAARDATASPDGESPPDAAGHDAGPPMPGRVTRVYISGRDGVIVVAEPDLTTGEVTGLSTTAVGGSPSFLAADPSGRFLYAVNEAADEVIAFAITPGTGALTRLNAQPSQGGGPTHVSVDGTGRWVLVANYGGGTVAVFPIGADGSLGAAADTESPGNNAHQILVDPSNRFALAPCLGSDLVAAFAFDSTTGQLEPNGELRTASAAGPRHLAFNRTGDRVYLTNELDSTVQVIEHDLEGGGLTSVQTLSSLPGAFTGSNTTAEIAGDPLGRAVYVSNRGHDSIATFVLQADGRLAPPTHSLLEANTPRSFAIEPTAAFLYAGAQGSSEVVTFRLGPDGTATRLLTADYATGTTFVGAFAIPTG